MIEQQIEEQDLAFARELLKHANRWVAILNYGSDEEIIVASGGTIQEAREEAASKGFTDVTFFKAPDGQRSFIPTANAS
jgi:hypothetical protein